MTTIGILGGGQLARMLVLAGMPLGLRFIIVDNVKEACAGQVAPLIQADYRNFQALEEFAEQVDVATFDFENIPGDTAHWLAERTRVFPNPRALSIAQDRLEEKRLFQQMGLETAPFAIVETFDELVIASRKIRFPCVLKTRRLGYDGKGQYRLHSHADLEKAWQTLGGVPLILEAWVAFEKELSVIAVRSSSGEFRTYPLTQNWHSNGVLSASLAPAPDCAEYSVAAFRYAQTLAEKLDYVGVFALELFLVNGKLLGNEMAPRVHNSGHWTIEGTACSQFENHLRAILGLPLGDTSARKLNCMLNWVGELPSSLPILSESHAHWHAYGKTPRAGRKVGHATLCASSSKKMSERLSRIGKLLKRESQIMPVVKALKESKT